MDLVKVQILPADSGILLPHLFFQFFSLEKVLSEPAVEKPLISLAKLEAVAFVAIVLSNYLTLELVAYVPIIFLTSSLLSCSPSSSYLILLSYFNGAGLPF